MNILHIENIDLGELLKSTIKKRLKLHGVEHINFLLERRYISTLTNRGVFKNSKYVSIYIFLPQYTNLIEFELIINIVDFLYYITELRILAC